MDSETAKPKLVALVFAMVGGQKMDVLIDEKAGRHTLEYVASSWPVRWRRTVYVMDRRTGYSLVVRCSKVAAVKLEPVLDVEGLKDLIDPNKVHIS